MRLHTRLERKMRTKRWEENYISKTLETITTHHQKKHRLQVMLDKALIWFALAVSVIGNFVISISLIPMIFFMPTILVVITASLLGLCFGMLIDVFMRDIDYISHHHYIMAGLFLPAQALINVVIVSMIIKEFQAIDALKPLLLRFSAGDIYLIMASYIICFLVPHGVYKMIEHMENRKELR